MRRIAPLFAAAVTLAWGLWFGGLITLFLAVTSLFATFAPDRALAGTAAAGVFHRFEAYRLALAAVAFVAAVAWRAAAPPPRTRRSLLLAAVSLAAGIALLSTFTISRRIEALRREKLTDTPEFRKLHGLSMSVYSAEALALLAAGFVLPGALRTSGNVARTEPA